MPESARAEARKVREREKEKSVNRSTGQSVLLSYVINEMLFHGAFDNEAPAT